MAEMPIPHFVHFALEGAEPAYRVIGDSYSLPMTDLEGNTRAREADLIPETFATAQEAIMAALAFASRYGAGWTIRYRASFPEA